MGKLYKIRRAILKDPNKVSGRYGIIMTRDGKVRESYWIKSYQCFVKSVLDSIKK